MDAELRRDWLQKLRSGQYEQAQGVLRAQETEIEYSYCCLGVLCEALGAQWIADIPTIGHVRLEADDEAILSDHGLRLAGLDEKTQTRLATMNDTGSSFAEIAHYIEENIPASVPPSPQEKETAHD